MGYSGIIWVNYNNLTATEPWNHGLLMFILGKIIPFYGRTIQVGEILFTQINGDTPRADFMENPTI